MKRFGRASTPPPGPTIEARWLGRAKAVPRAGAGRPAALPRWRVAGFQARAGRCGRRPVCTGPLGRTISVQAVALCRWRPGSFGEVTATP